MPTKVYELLKDSQHDDRAKAGMKVYRAAGNDFGLAADDTRATGIEYISVTPDGGYPFFTTPKQDLKPLPDLDPPDDAHVKAVCRPGEGAVTCRYLTMGAGGWSCEKFSSLRHHLDARVRSGSMNARGDNCEGRGVR